MSTFSFSQYYLSWSKHIRAQAHLSYSFMHDGTCRFTLWLQNPSFVGTKNQFSRPQSLGPLSPPSPPQISVDSDPADPEHVIFLSFPILCFRLWDANTFLMLSYIDSSVTNVNRSVNHLKTLQNQPDVRQASHLHSTSLLFGLRHLLDHSANCSGLVGSSSPHHPPMLTACFVASLIYKLRALQEQCCYL